MLQEHSTTSSERSSTLSLLSDSDKIPDSEATEEVTVRRKKTQSAIKSKSSAMKRKVLKELHIDLETNTMDLVSRYKRSGQTLDVTLKSLFASFYTRITEILHDQLSVISTHVDCKRRLNIEPFASISEEQIRRCTKVHELFALLGFSDAWLNTDNFMNAMQFLGVISSLRRPIKIQLPGHVPSHTVSCSENNTYAMCNAYQLLWVLNVN